MTSASQLQRKLFPFCLQWVAESLLCHPGDGQHSRCVFWMAFIRKQDGTYSCDCVFPSIKVFPNESVLRITWPKDWSFSFRVSWKQHELSGKFKNETHLLKETEGSNLFLEVQRLRLESLQSGTKISSRTLRISSWLTHRCPKFKA